MKDIVLQAKAGAEQMKTAPALLESAEQTSNVVAPIVDNAGSLANGWDPLLKRIGLFVTFVDGIAEVRFANESSSALLRLLVFA